MTTAAKKVKKPLPKPGRKASFKDAQKEILARFSGTFAKLSK